MVDFGFLVGVLRAVFVGIAVIGARMGVESLRAVTLIVARPNRTEAL